MLRQPRLNLHSAAILVAIALTCEPAFAFSSGNGGSQPPGEYHLNAPTLIDGQTANPLLDLHQRIIISPSSYPTQQPVSPAAGYVFPVSAPSTLPVHETGVSITSVSNFPSAQGVAPAPGASPFPVVQSSGTQFTVGGSVNVGPIPGGSPIPVSPASGSQFTVGGTVNVGNLPGTQLVGPSAANNAFNVNCVSGCSAGGGSGSSTSQGVYNSTLPTYTSGQTVTAQYDQNGRAIVSPFTISLPGPLAVTASSTLPVSLSAPVSVVTTAGLATLPGLSTKLGMTQYSSGVSSGLIILYGPGSLMSITNIGTASQSANMVCYNSATTAAGTVLWQGTLNPREVVNFGTWGMYASVGVFCQPSAATNAPINFVDMYQ